MEEWKNVIGYEGLYEISNIGNVRNVRRNKLLKLIKTNLGYIQVNLYKNGIMTVLRVHRLVAQAFIPNPDNLPDVNHKDEVKTNNNVDNLEWCDRNYNNNYGHRTENSLKTKIKNGYVNEENVGLSKKEYMKKYYQEHKEKLYEKNKEWRENNREKYNERKRLYRLKKKNQ